jgi:hypothetical protein
MLSRTEDADRLFDLAKRLRDEHRKYARLSEKAQTAEGKAYQRVSVDLHHQAHHICTIEAEIHAAAVDAGLADLREPDHYRERTWKPDGWHEYRWTPAKPRDLADAAA